MESQATPIGNGTPHHVTPLPKKQLLILAIILFSEPMNLTILFPFVYFMVRDFDIGNDENIGVYVGLLASSYAAAQCVVSVPWGRLSDYIGRRPVLLLGLIGISFAMILFGFSKNYTWAIVSRLLCGVLNGNVGVARSVVGEITDATNQARGFSVIGFAVGTGFILGPLLGGFLSDPAHHFPGLENSEFFLENPYFLPCFASASISMVGFFLAFVFFEETSQLKDKNRKGSENLKLTLKSTSDTASDIDYEKGNCCSKMLSFLTCSSCRKNNYQRLHHDEHDNSFFAVVKNSLLVTSVLIYAILGLSTIMFDEGYPLWAASDVQHGGLGFDSEEIGFTLSMGGIALLVTQLLVYPFVQPVVGTKNLFIISELFMVPVSIAFPFLSRLIETNNSAMHGLLITLISVRAMFNTLCFTSSMLFVNNSVVRTQLGAANGFSMTTISFARACGPFLAGALWSWSSTYNKFPFDYHFIFMLIGFVCFVDLVLACTLPRSINTVRVVENRRFSTSSSIPPYDERPSFIYSKEKEPLLQTKQPDEKIQTVTYQTIE